MIDAHSIKTMAYDLGAVSEGHTKKVMFYTE
jgi:hypothetical protein